MWHAPNTTHKLTSVSYVLMIEGWSIIVERHGPPRLSIRLVCQSSQSSDHAPANLDPDIPQ